MDADRAADAVGPALTRAKLALMLEAGCSRNHSRWVDPVWDSCQRYGVTTERRASMFVATCSYESGGFQTLVESLNYSAERLWQVFSHHFESRSECDEFAGDQVRTAERVYGGRMGNAPEGKGDGWRFRGRGPIMITGADEYYQFQLGSGLMVVQDPDLVIAPVTGSMCAAWCWDNAGCSPYADRGDFAAVSGLINRGRASARAEGLPARFTAYDEVRRAAA